MNHYLSLSYNAFGLKFLNSFPFSRLDSDGFWPASNFPTLGREVGVEWWGSWLRRVREKMIDVVGMSKTEMGCRLWICYRPSVGSRLVGCGSSRRVSSVKSVSLSRGLAARQLKVTWGKYEWASLRFLSWWCSKPSSHACDSWLRCMIITTGRFYNSSTSASQLISWR